MQFPNVDGENLAGDRLAFPRDFGIRTIALVAFDLEARAALESWVPFVDRYARAGTIGGRVFPAITRSMRAMKGMITTTMRSAARSPEARAATVPLFVDLDAFCRALEVGDRSKIQIYVVEPNGSILEHKTGSFTAAAGTALEAYVNESV